MMKRQVQDCSFRRMADSGDVCCDLLRQISGVVDEALLVVPEGACQACCDSFPPTSNDLNPIAASLLYQLAQHVSSRSNPELDQHQCQQLSELALRHIPTLLPDEDDCVDDVQRFAAVDELTLPRIAQTIPVVSATTPLGKQWAIGVTTSPRRQPTIEICLRSVLACHWTELTVFSDGERDSSIQHFDLPVVESPGPSGAWPAWKFAFNELLSGQPDADAYLLIQDDALFPATVALREYLESALWPVDDQCIVSLYTSADYASPLNGWFARDAPWYYGAVAWLFPPTIARQLAGAITIGELETVTGSAGIDTRVGKWAWQHRIPVWSPTPSLVQHIGQISTVWEFSRAVGLRRASRFLLDEWNQQ